LVIGYWIQRGWCSFPTNMKCRYTHRWFRTNRG
jgi:hypothetical protein